MRRSSSTESLLDIIVLLFAKENNGGYRWVEDQCSRRAASFSLFRILGSELQFISCRTFRQCAIKFYRLINCIQISESNLPGILFKNMVQWADFKREVKQNLIYSNFGRGWLQLPKLRVSQRPKERERLFATSGLKFINSCRTVKDVSYGSM